MKTQKNDFKAMLVMMGIGHSAMAQTYRNTGSGNWISLSTWQVHHLVGFSGLWWSYSENSPSNGSCRCMGSSFEDVSRGGLNKNVGYSLRCVRD